MKCHNAKKLIFDFIDGLEDDTQRLELEKHLAQCGECDKLASQLTRSMDLLHRAPSETTSDNFAWKVRLKLNQEKNAIQQQSESFGTMIRSWNLRYAATAVTAAAAVLVVGLFAVNQGLAPIAQSPASVAQDEAAVTESPALEIASGGDAASEPLSRPVDSAPTTESTVDRPHLQVTFPRHSTNFLRTSPGASSGAISTPMLGLIDREAPMSVRSSTRSSMD
jgi:anti-sigma factor RsiW